MIRLVVVGTSSTGKSALAGALRAALGGADLQILDTPPLDRLSRRMDADAYLLVCDKDLIDIEYQQVLAIVRGRRPVGVALNKADTYSAPQRRQLLQHIRRRFAGTLPPERVAACAADPVRIVLHQASDGNLTERSEPASPDVAAIVEVVHGLASDARSSLRVRARSLAQRVPLALQKH